MIDSKEVSMKERSRITEELLSEGIKLMESKYGSGANDGEHPLAYHNKIHVEGVINAAREMIRLAIERKKITISDGDLLLIAVGFHDVEQLAGSGKNEKESGRIAGEHMRRKEIFTEDEITRVEELIKATRGEVDNDHLNQSATDDYLSKLICDSDLANFGKPFDVFWDRSLRVYKELEKRDSFSDVDYRRIALGQINLLKNHNFYTEEAREVFDQKNQNIARLYQIVAGANPKAILP